MQNTINCAYLYVSYEHPNLYTFLGHSVYKNSKLILTRTERGGRVVSTYASYSGSPAFKSRHRRRATLTEVFPVIGNAIYILE
jgi:hypothetical protein